MEVLHLDHDIDTFCVTATSFPDGVLAAHQQLHGQLPTTEGRRFFGISYPNEQREIIYKAAVEEAFEDEGRRYGREPFTIRRGPYVGMLVHDYMKDIPAIGRAFEKLLTHPNIDPEGYCVEEYIDDHLVRCMVPLVD